MHKLLALLACISLVGCVGSLHPLYTGKDLIFDPALVGSWSEGGSGDVWTLTKKEGEDMAYRAVCSGDEHKSECVVYLVELKGAKFLDVYIKQQDSESLDTWPFRAPAHLFIRLRPCDSGYEICVLDSDWLKEYLGKKKFVVKHETLKDDLIVLTAKPKKLQHFLLRHLNTVGAFTDWTNWERVSEDHCGKSKPS